MNPEQWIGSYVVVFLIALTVYGIWNERRRRSFEMGRSEDHIFRCTRCSLVYTDDPDVDRSRCPQCGRTNEPFEF